MKTKEKPKIYSFLDLIQYLEVYFKWRKATDPKFSYSQWTTELNIGNKTTIRFILQRKRRISKITAQAIKKHLNLDHQEEFYYDYLLIYSQPKSEAERNAAGSKLIEIQRHLFKAEEFEESVACRNVYGPIVLTLIMFKDFIANEANIVKLIKINPSQLKDLLNFYVENNVLTKSADNIYSILTDSIKVNDKPNAKSLREYHEFWLAEGAKALNLDFSLRRFRSLNFALSENEFNDLVDRINDFAIGLLSKYSTDRLSDRRMYMLETALFPISEKLSPSKQVDLNESRSDSSQP